MNELKIIFRESIETNDHEACIIVDGEDWLGKEYMGMDPPRLFRQGSLFTGGWTVVGRCNCGCEGCGDIVVNVTIHEDSVTWESSTGYTVEFDKQSYFSEIREKSNDHSWENANRTAERLVDAVFESLVIEDEYEFDWSTARHKEFFMTLSFSNGRKQKLFKFRWDGANPNTAYENALLFRKSFSG